MEDRTVFANSGRSGVKSASSDRWNWSRRSSCKFYKASSLQLTFCWAAQLSMASSDLLAGSRDGRRKLRRRTWASGPSRWIDTSIRWPRNFSELEIFHRCRAISPLDCFVINVYARRITLSFCFAPSYFVICHDACHHLLNFSAWLSSSGFPPFARLSSERETRAL